MQEDSTSALAYLFEETASLFHRLRAVASQVHGQNELSAGRRGVLRSLYHLGPQTVPQLARSRPVSRQHIQILVNGLLKDALVATEENPAHRRSPLIRLTSKGKRHLEAMQKRELRLLAQVHLDLTVKDLASAAATLQSVRYFLESKEWRKQVAKLH